MRLRAYQRLFLSYLLLVSLLVLALSVGADSLLRRHLVSAEEDHLRRELALAAAFYDSAPEISPDSAASLLGSFSGRRVTVVAPDGRVLGESESVVGGHVRMENHRARPEIQAALRGGVAVAVRASTTLGAEHMYVAGLTTRGEVLRLALPLVQLESAIRRVQRGILGVGAAVLLLAAVFSLGFSLAVTRPLRRMQVVASSMAAGDLSRRLRERRRDELGDLARSLDVLADELQRRLGQLDAERTEMKTLIDSMSEGVLAVGPDGMLRRANPAATRMFSLPDHPEGIPPEAVARRPEFLRLVSRALQGQVSPATELVSDDRALIGTAHPLPEGGAVLVFLDVSELRRLESVRRDFVANASHELKTPLTVLRGYSETLVDPDLPPELTRRFAQTVKENADRLQRIVDDLLDLSRLESGGWRADPRDVRLSAVCGEVWAEQGDAAERVDLRLDLDPGADLVSADPAALRQILSNLFSNALRYTPAGGSVSVRSRRLPAQASTGGAGDGGWIEIEIRDTGAGIPAVHLPRVFERFYRADPGRSRDEGGTGLGLAIVRHLVEAHGGRITAHSQLGHGTAMRFTLPAARRDDRSP